MLLSRFPVNIDQTKLCHVLLGNFKRWRKVYLRLLLRPIAQIGFNSRYWLYCNLSLRVSRTKIKNLRWQVSEDINFITCGKFVTSLVQKLKKKMCSRNYESRYWLQISLFTFFLTNFLKVTWIISPLTCHLRFSIFVLETFKFKKKGLAMSVPWIESHLWIGTKLDLIHHFGFVTIGQFDTIYYFTLVLFTGWHIENFEKYRYSPLCVFIGSVWNFIYRKPANFA